MLKNLKLVIPAGLIVAAVALAGSLMYLQITRSNAALSDAEAGLASATNEISAQVLRNNELSTANDSLRSSLDDATDRNAELASMNDGLSMELTSSHELNEGLEAAIERVSVELEDAAAMLEAAAAMNETLASENASLKSDLQAATAENTQLVTKLGSEAEDLLRLRGQYGALLDTVGSLEAAEAAVATLETQRDALRSDIQELRSDIQELRAERAPLVLQSDVSSFLCTGSMEPTLTCLDTITMLEDFAPADIVIGAIISFAPVEACGSDAAKVAHRVLDIKVVGGVHYYWPKGDANDAPDECWIPEGNVNGYVIAVQKNVQPENSALRGFVNDSTEDLKSAIADMAASLKKHNDAYDRWCSHVASGETCYLPHSQVTELNILWGHYLREFERYDDVYDSWQCWQGSAASARYYTDGRPPLYSYCLPPLSSVPGPAIPA